MGLARGLHVLLSIDDRAVDLQIAAGDY